MKLCYENKEITPQWPIQLWQGSGQEFNFTVVFGAQERKGLDYGRAATELGLAIMHALACQGKIR